MPFLKLDDALVEMIEWARERLQKLLDQAHCGTDPWDADIQWDYPIQGTDELDEVDMEATHAVGFIAGVAAAFNVTPLELLDTVKHLPNRRDERRALPTKEQCQTCGYAVVQGATGLVHAGTVRGLRPHKVNGPFEDTGTFGSLKRGIDAVIVDKAPRPRAKRRQKIRTIK